MIPSLSWFKQKVLHNIGPCHAFNLEQDLELQTIESHEGGSFNLETCLIIRRIFLVLRITVLLFAILPNRSIVNVKDHVMLTSGYQSIFGENRFLQEIISPTNQ